MVIRLCTILLLLGPTTKVGANTPNAEQRHIEVALRTIGHQLMQAVCNDTSVVSVKPIDNDAYKLSFTAPFSFDPGHLYIPALEVIKAYGIQQTCYFEIRSCKDGSALYNMEIWTGISPSMIPCEGRILPEDYYDLYIHLYDLSDKADQETTWLPWWTYPILLVAMILSALMYIRHRASSSIASLQASGGIAIGTYIFDSMALTLRHDQEVATLSHKEATLLQYLHNHQGETVSRSELLSKVWGDDGDYIGRTLDVYVSKLRKRLQADPLVKITNERGVGYRMVIG